MAKTPTTEEHWVPARALVWRLSTHVGGDDRAKQLIASRMKDHGLDPKVDWCAEGVDAPQFPAGKLLRYPTDTPPVDLNELIRLASFPTVSATEVGSNFVRSLHAAEAGIPLRIGPRFWTKSDDLDADIKRWKWGPGCFVVTWTAIAADGAEVRMRSIAHNVQFRASDAANLIASVVVPGPTPPKRRAARKYDWEEIILALMKIVRNPGFEAEFGEIDRHGTLANLESWIHGKFGDADLDVNEAYVRERAQQFIDAIR